MQLEDSDADPAAPLQPIGSNPAISFAAVCVLICGAMCCFYLPLSAVPAFVGKTDGPLASGMVTGCLMGATLVAEALAARALRRYGRRKVCIGALLALALPSLGLFDGHLPVVLGASVIRGFGLGFLLVACSGYVALIAPTSHLNRYMGIYGMASGVPALVAVPLGLLIVEKLPAHFAGWLGCLLGLIAIPFTAPMRTRVSGGAASSSATSWVSYRAPIAQMALAAATAGVVFTFLPIILGPGSKDLIAFALFAHGAAAVAARAAAGRYVDRNGSRQVLALGLFALAAAIGLLTTPSTVWRLIGVVTAGAAFGLVQCASLNETLRRCAGDKDGASASWNFAYDLGLGLGAIVFGSLSEFVEPRLGLLAFAFVAAAAVVMHWYRTTSGATRNELPSNRHQIGRRT